jgi:hypothetical protein
MTKLPSTAVRSVAHRDTSATLTGRIIGAILQVWYANSEANLAAHLDTFMAVIKH